VFAGGRRSADRLFTVLYRPSGLACARLGITISARRVRTAVARNRIRRLIRESFRHAGRGLEGFDIVVIVSGAAREAGNPAIFESLTQHWARLRHAGQRT